MWRFRSYFLLFFLSTVQALFAQTAIKEQHPLFRKIAYPFLPALTFSKIFFTADGLLWYSSIQGLVSFDGLLRHT
jgi:hypothetical protein